MSKKSMINATGIAAGAILVTGIAIAPALAEYPPAGGTSSPASVSTSSNPGSVSSASTSGSGTAVTGAATTLGLIAGLAVLGAGSGLLIASRRRQS